MSRSRAPAPHVVTGSTPGQHRTSRERGAIAFRQKADGLLHSGDRRPTTASGGADATLERL